MSFKEIIAVYSENSRKPINNTVCRESTWLGLLIKPIKEVVLVVRTGL
jgi:hypothetical protein